jgi:futalosine hydrolase
MILVVCAVAKELSFLASRDGVEVLVTGVGPVEAAAEVARALATNGYTAVVNAGIAGAFPGAADVGDSVVVAEDTIELDLENGTPLSLPDGLHVHQCSASDAGLVNALRSAGFPCLRGVTVSRVTATDATSERLRSMGAEVESMEGFSVLRAAEIAHIRAIQVRGISNLVCDRAKSNWNFAAGVAGLERILTATLDLLQQ